MHINAAILVALKVNSRLCQQIDTILSVHIIAIEKNRTLEVISRALVSTYARLNLKWNCQVAAPGDISPCSLANVRPS